MPSHRVINTPPIPPPTADEAARAIYGMSAKSLVRAILENKDGRFDRLYKGAADADPADPERRTS